MGVAVTTETSASVPETTLDTTVRRPYAARHVRTEACACIRAPATVPTGITARPVREVSEITSYNLAIRSS